MEAEGVVFRTGCNVGTDVSADEILKNYDAVLLSCGAKKARPLAAKNIGDARGVYYAVDYLTSATKHILDVKKFIDAKGRNVVIVGGGDTGNDCVGTSIRQGAASVVQLEMMPEPPLSRTASNPWPEWPKVKKTDYGQIEAEGVFGKDPRIYQTTVEEVICDKKGSLKAIRTVKVAFENGKLVTLEGSQQELSCQLLIIAAGFLGAESYTPEAFKAPLDSRNRVKTKENSMQVDGKVFSAGDMRRGQSLVVWAIAEGQKAAKEIDGYLLCWHI